jgi:uncharacterized protein
MSKLTIKDDWVLVTGASSGIGHALAQACAALGARLLLVARNRDRLLSVAKSLDVPTQIVAADLTTDSGRDAVFSLVAREQLPISHVINNAGFGLAGSFSELDLASQCNSMELNCGALIRITHHFLPGMLDRQRGGFMQIASVAGLSPIPFMAVYGGAKAFVHSFSIALHNELRGTGVHSTVVCPGPVETGFQQRAGYHLGGLERRSALSPDRVAASALRAYLARKAMVAPGLTNAVVSLGAACAPPAASAAVAGGVMRRGGRHKSR